MLSYITLIYCNIYKIYNLNGNIPKIKQGYYTYLYIHQFLSKSTKYLLDKYSNES